MPCFSGQASVALTATLFAYYTLWCLATVRCLYYAIQHTTGCTMRLSTDLLMLAAIYCRRSSPVEGLPSTILRCVAANIGRSDACKRYSWLHRLCPGGLSDQEVINFAITFPCSLLDFVCS